MPYITVRSAIRPSQIEGFGPTPTFIDCYADFDEEDGREIQDAMVNLGGRCCPNQYGRRGQASRWRVYSISQPPHFVLNGLEKLAGYKVVASNSITESNTIVVQSHSHYQIWTLHKQT